MAHSSLTSGALARICQGEDVLEPILQVLGHKAFLGSGQERFRLLLNDGEYSSSFTMLATQLNSLVHEDKIPQFSVIKLKNHICNQVAGQTKRVVIVLALEVLQRGEAVARKIGDPVTISSDGIAPPSNIQKQRTKEEAEELLHLLIEFRAKVQTNICTTNIERMRNVNDEALKREIKNQEDVIDKVVANAESFIVSKKGEVTKMIKEFEEVEDLQLKKIKELSNLDVKRAQLVRECEEKKEVMKELNEKKRKLEQLIPMQIRELRKYCRQDAQNLFGGQEHLTIC